MIQGRSIALGAALTLGLVAVLRPVGTTAQGAASTLGARRCVGMFVAPEYRGQTIPATLNGMKVVGEAPCGGQFLGFAPQGVCRAWDDGSVEMLASPVPPCPGETVWVWLSFPP